MGTCISALGNCISALGNYISTLGKNQSSMEFKRGKKRGPSEEENQEDCGPSSGDNGPGKRKARKEKADADSESSSDSSSSCDEDPPRKSRGKKGTTESRDIPGARDSNAPGDYELGEDEKKEIAKGLAKIKYLNEHAPDNVRVKVIANKYRMDGTDSRVLDIPESRRVLQCHTVAEDVVIGGISKAVLLTDGNPEGKAVHTCANTLTVEKDGWSTSVLGSKKTVEFARYMEELFRNSSGNSQRPQTLSTNLPAPAEAAGSSKPRSIAPAKRLPDNVKTLRDLEGSSNDETRRGNTAAAASSSYDREEVRAKRLKSQYIKNASRQE